MGVDGFYEICNKTSIIKRMIDKYGNADEKYKIYRDVNNIPSRQDRLGIEQVLKVNGNSAREN
jgi:hypothetical protein